MQSLELEAKLGKHGTINSLGGESALHSNYSLAVGLGFEKFNLPGLGGSCRGVRMYST